MNDDELLMLLGTQYNPEILGATAEAQSAKELSERLSIPIATCYRRIEELTEAGLLTLEDRVLSDDRRRTSVYRREIDEVRVTFDEGSFDVEVTGRPEIRNKLDDVWRTITHRQSASSSTTSN